jgi:hypothetical protein
MYRPADLVFAVVMLSLLALTLMAHHGGVKELFSNPYMPLLAPVW